MKVLPIWRIPHFPENPVPLGEVTPGACNHTRVERESLGNGECDQDRWCFIREYRTEDDEYASIHYVVACRKCGEEFDVLMDLWRPRTADYLEAVMAAVMNRDN